MFRCVNADSPALCFCCARNAAGRGLLAADAIRASCIGQPSKQCSTSTNRPKRTIAVPFSHLRLGLLTLTMPPGKHCCLRLLSVWQRTVPAAHRLQYGADITCKACGKTSFAVEVGLFTIHRPWRGKSRALPTRQCHATDSEGGGIRTRDLRIKSPLLYLLSYALGARLGR